MMPQGVEHNVHRRRNLCDRTVKPAVMPQGVEHAMPCLPKISCATVKPAVMPQGVEHAPSGAGASGPSTEWKPAVMPQGVEHRKIVEDSWPTRFEVKTSSDAARR